MKRVYLPIAKREKKKRETPYMGTLHGLGTRAPIPMSIQECGPRRRCFGQSMHGAQTDCPANRVGSSRKWVFLKEHGMGLFPLTNSSDPLLLYSGVEHNHILTDGVLTCFT